MMVAVAVAVADRGGGGGAGGGRGPAFRSRLGPERLFLGPRAGRGEEGRLLRPPRLRLGGGRLVEAEPAGGEAVGPRRGDLDREGHPPPPPLGGEDPQEPPPRGGGVDPEGVPAGGGRDREPPRPVGRPRVGGGPRGRRDPRGDLGDLLRAQVPRQGPAEAGAGDRGREVPGAEVAGDRPQAGGQGPGPPGRPGLRDPGAAEADRRDEVRPLQGVLEGPAREGPRPHGGLPQVGRGRRGPPPGPPPPRRRPAGPGGGRGARGRRPVDDERRGVEEDPSRPPVDEHG
jgi:hypothetical protein